MRVKYFSLAFISLLVFTLSACEQQAKSMQSEANTMSESSPFIVTASIQEIMQSEVDPSADYLWESISFVSTADGFEQHQPRTEEEWLDVRHKAITLIEASNLLAMQGRHVVEEGKHLEDEGLEGNLTAAQIQQLIDADHSKFVTFAHGLHSAGTEVLAAIDNKDVDAFLEAGGTLDMACEACHVQYWYPNQVIPPVPDPPAVAQ